MVKVKKGAEKKTEILAVRKSARIRKDTGRRSSIVLPIETKSKGKTKQKASTATDKSKPEKKAKTKTTETEQPKEKTEKKASATTDKAKTKEKSKTKTTDMTEQPKEKTKKKASATTDKAKTKEKSKTKTTTEQPKEKGSKRNQSKNVPSTSKASPAKKKTQTPRTVRNNHGDLLANLPQPLLRLPRMIMNDGKLSQLSYTRDLVQNWKKLAKQKNDIQQPVNKLKGIQYIPAASLRFMKGKGIRYAFYDTRQEENIRAGVIVIKPKKQKRESQSGQYIQFTVISGTPNVVCEDMNETFRAGAIFTISPNAKYSITNTGDIPCCLKFFSYGRDYHGEERHDEDD